MYGACVVPVGKSLYEEFSACIDTNYQGGTKQHVRPPRMQIYLCRTPIWPAAALVAGKVGARLVISSCTEKLLSFYLQI